MQNRLFVAYKPADMVCNHFLSRIKRRYGVKKAGFSGTLDPFAKGVLIVAFGQYTRLFRFLKKAPKTYRATLWLGAFSPTLDNEKIERVTQMAPFHPDSIAIALKSMIGQKTYLPPKYSAKKIEGKRAYDLARSEQDFEMKMITSEVYECHLVHYAHPFLTFEMTISEGGYVRSMGEMIAKKLGFEGCLSALERLNEGAFVYEHEKALNPLAYLDLPRNGYLGDPLDVLLGRKLQVENFEKQEEGIYYILNDEMLSIVQLSADGVEYLLNSLSLKA
ncbi:tRNA pseudouridine(55) synthase TruB [Sulfurospirillum deleyianum]|uniref:tRNA pseudouridine(55) synthase n=1 Tax=Sulfurospirillum deleyianum (strain ATCC 51133 / DSM 6946 / 5175) TaxID=525898 RepID=D1B3H7_SULD5|nr:tRNA pseudouridine(55) synthase TruB [Sulfurospirillum deleyianum]ACZ12647.1 pseudouridylate synthase TruB domain protein [Sulfurospirillum deleyianum DSM 6946]